MPIEPVEFQIEDVVPPDCTSAFLLGKRKETVIYESHVIAYGERLVSVAKRLRLKGYDAFIAPLRGGLRPWVQLNIIARTLNRTLFLPFSQASSGMHRDEIYAYLGNWLRTVDADGILKLAVIDVGEGGGGSLTLAQYLKELHNYQKAAHWEIDFYILFARRRRSFQVPPKSLGIEKLSNDDITFRLTTWNVPAVVGEDWNEAMGIKVRWTKMKPHVEFQSTAGDMVFVQRSGQSIVVKSGELHLLLDAILSKVVNEIMATDPDLPHIGDIWNTHFPHLVEPPRVILPGDEL
jgi:hypothetical protein